MSQAIESAFAERNPFMLLMHPEVVLAAVENSARLNSLNRHTCRPLDRPVPGADNSDANDAKEPMGAANDSRGGRGD